MGTTLENGVYLPSEGERNCYAGLKTNWEILDQKVADVTALQQAVAGALHREIVESLPTTDIDPNTIYMILSGTSATENVYNEFMYVNNAWELIGTSATDLTNYYTKGDVDGLLLLKANASDLTSHTGDTTIHVTTADKTKWNNGVSQSYVLRYSGTAVVPNSTIAYSTIDNTDNIKSGDKILDVDGKMFEITAVDTANQTVTVGSALIDLALDGNVVHRSGTETISGFKTFENIKLTNSIKAIALDGETVDINNCYSSFAEYGGYGNGNIAIYSCNTDGNTSYISNLPEPKAFYLISITIRYFSGSPTVKQILFTRDNVRYERFCYGGTWSNWIKDTDKFVTTDTDQSVSGQKVFSDINAISSSAEIGVSGGNNSFKILDKNKKTLLRLEGGTFSTGMSYSYWLVNNGTDVFNGLSLDQASANLAQLRPYSSTLSMQLGASNRYFYDCYTSKINNLEPSSLFMPVIDRTKYVDISGYFTNTGNGDINTYSVTANGWIYLRLTDIGGCQLSVLDSSNNRLYGSTSSGNLEQLCLPVTAGTVVETQWTTSTSVTVAIARFIPCQGNV